MEYLKQSSLDDWTYNKALQKITESFRVDKETKKHLGEYTQDIIHQMLEKNNPLTL